MIYRRIAITDRDERIVSVEPVASSTMPRWADNVPTQPFNWPSASTQPVFLPPIPFVIQPPQDDPEPFFSHNHCPAITWCANGDLLAAWFSTQKEVGTEMTILASRLRAGAAQWDPAAEFFKAPDRNMTGTALFHDGAGKIIHINGVGAQGQRHWKKLAMLMRISHDHGVNWSCPQPISTGAGYLPRHQIIAGTSMTQDGTLIQPCDATHSSEGPSTVHVSRDQGMTWHPTAGDIRGIHAGVVGLHDNTLLALGRGQTMEGRMPASRSTSTGQHWESEPSPFPPISTGQRLVLMRLQEGPLLLASFTDGTDEMAKAPRQGMTFIDPATGRSFTGYGLFVAISPDDGTSWPVRRLLTPGDGHYNGGAWTGPFTTSATEAEPKGYLAATQSPDGIIHLISSALHYRFNVAWLQQCG